MGEREHRLIWDCSSEPRDPKKTHIRFNLLNVEWVDYDLNHKTCFVSFKSGHFRTLWNMTEENIKWLVDDFTYFAEQQAFPQMTIEDVTFSTPSDLITKRPE